MGLTTPPPHRSIWLEKKNSDRERVKKNVLSFIQYHVDATYFLSACVLTVSFFLEVRENNNALLFVSWLFKKTEIIAQRIKKMLNFK